MSVDKAVLKLGEPGAGIAGVHRHCLAIYIFFNRGWIVKVKTSLQMFACGFEAGWVSDSPGWLQACCVSASHTGMSPCQHAVLFCNFKTLQTNKASLYTLARPCPKGTKGVLEEGFPLVIEHLPNICVALG